MYACDGNRLSLQCPRHSTISIQSAFYGQDYQMCNSQQPATMMKDHLTCVAPTALQVLHFIDFFEYQNNFKIYVHTYAYILNIYVI